MVDASCGGTFMLKSEKIITKTLYPFHSHVHPLFMEELVQKTKLKQSLSARDVKEAKLPVSSLGLDSIRLDSCATRLLNELLVDTKLYSIIKRNIPV
jgi:hypothetical protein